MRNRPDKVTILQQLKTGGFNVPDFIYVPAEHLAGDCLGPLDVFLDRWKEDYKVIVRSAHPLEAYYRGGTFDSLESTADVGGIRFAWRKIIYSCQTSKHLNIRRQQTFDNAPPIDPGEMGVIVMPFIEGQNIMAKMIGENWEFGYCTRSDHLVFRDPFLTLIPHDVKLLELSRSIQDYLGFRCEIEYVQARDGRVFVVQARDISGVPTTEEPASSEFDRLDGERVRLDGVHRIRSRCNRRERPVFVMDNRDFFLRVVDACEDFVEGVDRGLSDSVDSVLEVIYSYEMELEAFALSHERYAVLGTTVHLPELFQITNHCLDEMPEGQRSVADALRRSQYSVEYFLAEADTLIAKDKIRFNLCTHNAYGISTVRNPLWTVFWSENRNDAAVRSIQKLGIRNGDFIGIDINTDGIPTLYRV